MLLEELQPTYSYLPVEHEWFPFQNKPGRENN